MKLMVSGCLAASLTLAATWERPELTVYAYNYAGIETGTVAVSQSEASRIFEQAGLIIRWVDCPGDGIEICSTPRDRRHLELRMFKGVRTLPAGVQPTSLGFSLHPSDGAVGTLANVLVDRVQALAVREGLPLGVLLGHVFAHELAHLMLGAGSHTSLGLMCPSWGKLEFAWAVQGTLALAPADAARIRSNLRVSSAVAIIN